MIIIIRMQRKLNTINEDEQSNMVVNFSGNELDFLQSEMLLISNKIAQELYTLKSYSFSANHILHCNFNTTFMNTNFEEQELIEEQLDRFVHQYTKIKENFKKGREIRYHKEQKEKEKMNELRYARNVLAQLGIDRSQE